MVVSDFTNPRSSVSPSFDTRERPDVVRHPSVTFPWCKRPRGTRPRPDHRHGVPGDAPAGRSPQPKRPPARKTLKCQFLPRRWCRRYGQPLVVVRWPLSLICQEGQDRRVFPLCRRCESRMDRREATARGLSPSLFAFAATVPDVSCGNRLAVPCRTSSSVVGSRAYASPQAAATSPRWTCAARRIAPRRRTSARVARTSSGEDVGWPREILLASASLAHRVGFAGVQTLHPPMSADQTG